MPGRAAHEVRASVPSPQPRLRIHPEKTLKLVPDVIRRTLLFPALRLMRAQMKLISDPVHLREMAARVDALGQREPDVQIEPVTAGTAPAL